MTGSKDEFVNTLIAQYREEIEQILVESEHVYRSTIDYEMLDQKICEILKSAKVDGLEEKIFWDIVHSIIPTYVNYLNSLVPVKKAA